MISIDTSTNITKRANKLSEPVKDGGRSALKAWAATHPDMAQPITALLPN